MWCWVNPGASWLTLFISQQTLSVWVLIAVLSLYAVFNHFYVLWNNLPNWYNMAVVLIFPPTLYLGILLVKRR